MLGFCQGRIDAEDGSESVQLGPSLEQETLYPCEVNGECEDPLGANTIGLIYVNPEGHMADGDPYNSANDIRDVFGRMGMDDEETVALIAGGHSFGKAHGACPDGPGPSPVEDPLNPWPGNCGSGKGKDTFTSGFELPFTRRPTYWDNEYLTNLLTYPWEIFSGPGGHKQWRPVVDEGQEPPLTVSADGSYNESIGLLTSDVALLVDPHYRDLIKSFAEDMEYFDEMFAHGWYQLTTRDMGPRTRCANADAPPPQHWQYPLPDRDQPTPDWDSVKQSVLDIIQADDRAVGLLTRLAWQCASTFRVTDYQGGCNGARIRHPPGSEWSVNVNLDTALSLLEPVKQQYGASLSWADLILLGGTSALEHSGNMSIAWCGVGRVDADREEGEEQGWQFLQPRVTGQWSETVALVKDYISVMGLTQTQFAALLGAGYTVGDAGHCRGFYCLRSSYLGHKTMGDTPTLSNAFFLDLLNNQWEPVTVGESRQMYKVRMSL